MAASKLQQCNSGIGAVTNCRDAPQLDIGADMSDLMLLLLSQLSHFSSHSFLFMVDVFDFQT